MTRFKADKSALESDFDSDMEAVRRGEMDSAVAAWRRNIREAFSGEPTSSEAKLIEMDAQGIESSDSVSRIQVMRDARIERWRLTRLQTWVNEEKDPLDMPFYTPETEEAERLLMEMTNPDGSIDFDAIIARGELPPGIQVHNAHDRMHILGYGGGTIFRKRMTAPRIVSLMEDIRRVMAGRFESLPSTKSKFLPLEITNGLDSVKRSYLADYRKGFLGDCREVIEMALDPAEGADWRSVTQSGPNDIHSVLGRFYDFTSQYGSHPRVDVEIPLMTRETMKEILEFVLQITPRLWVYYGNRETVSSASHTGGDDNIVPDFGAMTDTAEDSVDSFDESDSSKSPSSIPRGTRARSWWRWLMSRLKLFR